MRYFFLMCLALASPAAADEVSPWFGSADQTPFQIAADGSPVVTGPLKSDGRAELGGKNGCAIKGCSVAESTANVPGIGHVSP